MISITSAKVSVCFFKAIFSSSVDICIDSKVSIARFNCFRFSSNNEITSADDFDRSSLSPTLVSGGYQEEENQEYGSGYRCGDLTIDCKTASPKAEAPGSLLHRHISPIPKASDQTEPQKEINLPIPNHQRELKSPHIITSIL
jgi:hypothetical protein